MKRAPISIVGLLLASAVSAAKPIAGHGNGPASTPHLAEVVPSRGAAILLWDQLDFAGGTGSPNQDYEANFDANDCEAADDFVLPFGASWEITRIYATGENQTQFVFPYSADVWIYPDDGGKPGPSAACTYLDVGVAPDSWDITLPQSCILTGGVYWLSLQANQAAGEGQHFWKDRTVRTGYEGVWRSPGDGLGRGCTDWTPQRTCGLVTLLNPDLLFQVYGFPTEVLIDTSNHASEAGALSQDFEPQNDQYDSEAADDFFVAPKGGWLIRRVRTFGVQATGGTPDSVNVWIYADQGGYPAPIPTCEYGGLATANPAWLDVALEAPGCRVSPGNWWVEVQVNQSYGSGAHLWLRRSVPIGYTALFRNPLDGWESGCTDWGELASCLGGTDPDLLFVLEGLPGLVFEDDFEIESAGRWSSCSDCS